MIKKIKNPLIEKSRFLIIPEPFEDEIFSSWFARCAYAHKTHPKTFWNLHFPKDKFTYTLTPNFDATISDELLQSISLKTQFSISKLKNMTMMFYDSYLQEQIVRNRSNKFLINYRFCPKCFQEDNIPYIRKEHRVIFSTFCRKHKCYLQDKCPKCKTLMSPFKMFENRLAYDFCNKCGFKLKISDIEYVTNEFRYDLNIRLLDILNKGYIQLGNYFIYSFLFFDILFHICKLILLKKNIMIDEKDDKLVRKLLNKNFLKSKNLYTQISIKEQYILFGIVMSIFREYPKKFELFIIENNLPNFEMIRDMGIIPYWYEESVNEISPKVIYYAKMVTREEILNGIKYLKKRNVAINQTNLTKLLGCNFFSSYSQLKDLLKKLRNNEL